MLLEIKFLEIFEHKFKVKVLWTRNNFLGTFLEGLNIKVVK